MSSKISNAFSAYKSWVEQNPQTVSDSESVLKWCSYLLSGYVRNSAVLSELVFCSANLITFLNDRILAGSLKLETKQYGYVEHLLTVIEGVEVFLEIAASHFGGVTAKWAVIVSIQLLKTLLRLTLLVRDQRLIVNPLISPLDRSLLKSASSTDSVSPSSPPPASYTMTLKRSGRVIRKIEGAPPNFVRDWTVPASDNDTNNNHISAILKGKRKVAEIMHIVQPMVHLGALGLFGTRSWKPFLVSLAIDCSSHSLHGPLRLMTETERREMMRRRLSLLLYLLRSPLYDQKSKTIIVTILKFAQDNIPLLGSVAKAVLHNLAEYQEMYFYTWSS